MPRLSKRHELARRRLIDLAVGGHSPQRLAAQIMETLQEAVGWDGYRVFGLDESTVLVNRLLAASENDSDARLEFLREVYLALPSKYAELPQLTRSGLKVVAYQDRQESCFGFPQEQLAQVHPIDHYRHFHEYRSPVGGTLLGIFRDNGRPIAAFQAYRRSSNDQFRASDVSFMEYMSGIAGRALSNALVRERAGTLTAANADVASGVLMVGGRGDIRFATPAGERWLDLLGDRRDGLPPAIWAAIAELRSCPDLIASTITVPTAQATARIEASASGEPDVTAIVIALQAPPAMPEVPVSWHLTNQESQIVECLAMGKGNRDIAETMFIGEHTVEWHLRKIYSKLGVRNRQEVITALWRQVFLPGVEELELNDSVA
jgi:DNA-binding CsgD family transcriptional regulator